MPRKLTPAQLMQRDINDMLSAVQTIFLRCKCGRIREQGIVCPTVQEGGECVAGS